MLPEEVDPELDPLEVLPEELLLDDEDVPLPEPLPELLEEVLLPVLEPEVLPEPLEEEPLPLLEPMLSGSS